MSTYEWPVRVYYEDTDAGGVVYYANYLKFMERARSEWLRSLGIEQNDLRDTAGVLLMVHDLSVRYLRPARFNDQLDVSVKVKEVKRAKMVFFQQIKCLDSVLCQGEVSIACVNEASGRPVAFPQVLTKVFQGVSM